MRGAPDGGAGAAPACLTRDVSSRLYVDAPSLVYRAFFAVPASITDRDGRPVNAVRGFMDMIAWLLAERTESDVVTVFDADWRPAWRVEAYPGYKAERPPDPPELPPQFDVIATVLDAAGIERVEGDGYEADDVIATLIAAKEPVERAAIVTGDRDLLSLVRDPDVTLLWAGKSVRRIEEFDESAVEEKYGVPPSLYPELATLRGDPSDGLPGVAGIGPVRAARLLREYGSIARIIEELDSLPPNQAKAFEDARDYLAAAARVVPLVRDVAMRATEVHRPDEAALEALAKRYNLESPTARLLDALRRTRDRGS
jgi:5'-3' exonuclease